MATSPRQQPDNERGAQEALLAQLREQSAVALADAERWFEGADDAAGALEQRLSQLQGVASMAGLAGIASLAEAALAAVRAAGADCPDTTREALAEGLVALNGHLGGLRVGEPAPVSRYVADINRLRVAAGEGEVDGEALFVAQLEADAPYSFPAPPPSTGPSMDEIAAKFRGPAAKVFAALKRDGNAGPAFDALLKLATTLERASVGAEDRETWRLARTLLEQHKLGQVEDNGALRALLGELEVFLDDPAAQGDRFADWRYRAVYRLQHVDEIATRYGLVEGDNEAEDAGVRVDDARAALAKTAREELVRVRDAYDVFLRSGADDPELLKPAAARLQSIIAPLRVAGLASVSDLLDDALIAVAALVDGQPLGPAANMIADTLLHAEELLDSGVDGPAEKLRREAQVALVDCTLTSLKRVHQAIVEANEVGETDGLADIPAVLRSLAGALKVAGLSDAAQVARQSADALRAATRGGQSLDALAEALVCLELYIGAARTGATPNADLIDRARKALSGAMVDDGGDADGETDEPPVVSGSADPDLLAIYIEEAGEHLVSVRDEYAAMRENPDDDQMRIAVQRFFHTLKGSGRMVGATRMAEFAWAFEQLMSGFIERKEPLQQPVLELVAAAIIALGELREQLEGGTEPVVAIATLRAAAARPDDIPKGLAASVVAAVTKSGADVVRRWLDAVIEGKGSGRVPPAVPTALARVEDAASLLGNSNIVESLRELREHVEGSFEVDAEKARELAATLEQITGTAEASSAATSVDTAAAETYRDEARGLLDRMGDALDALLLDAGDADAVLTLQRNLHTLKGTSRVAGFRELPDSVHQLEVVLQAVAQERTVVTPRLLWMLQRVFDAMFGMLDPDSEELAASRGRTALQELSQLSGDDRSMPPLPSGADRRRKPRVSIESERVRTDQLDRALVRALSLGLRTSHLDARMHEQTMWNVTAVSEMLQDLSTDVRAIRDALIRSRQAPVHLHASRWRRAVRQAAEDAGREVELRFEGSDTELDRRLLDGLVGPFEHLLRNAVSHGIESPFTRRAADKPPGGTIFIRTLVDGDGVVVEVEDDGAGIDPDKLRRSARERGLAVPDGALDADAILKLIATPGFSTASQLTQSSGFGIGLDSVLVAVRELGGSVHLETTPGKGTKFVLNLPNPSPVIQVDLYQVGTALVAIAPSAVVTARAVDEDTVGVEHDGEHWPWLDVGAAIGIIGARAAVDSNIAVLLRHGDRGAAVRADAALGRTETAVHRLRPGELSEGQSVAGVGLLDGGKLATVLHVEAALKGFEGALRIRPFALVADDSPTARDDIVRKLEQSGWRVLAVEDGATARKHLVKARPQLVVLDIDMPGLNGLELLEWIRDQKGLEQTPVIMASAALDDERRRKARELSATACLDKPFKGSEFEDTLASLSGSG